IKTPMISAASATANPGAAERLMKRGSAPPRKHMLDLRVGGRAMIEPRVEVAGQRPEVFWKKLWIDDFGKPPQPDEPVYRWREVDPSERHLRREMHAAIPHGLYGVPQRIVRYAGREVAIDRDDHVRVPEQHLLDRDKSQPTRPLARHVSHAHELDSLDVDRARH